MIGFIWLAVAVDIWCCQWLTADAELNPMVRTILVSHGVWTLVATKVVATFAVTELLRYLRLIYSIGVAGAMLALILILSGAIPV